MGLIDELDEKAKELAAKAKAALDDPNAFLAKVRERAEEAVAEAREDVEEFAAEAREELREARTRLADFLVRDARPAAESAPKPDLAEEPAPEPAPTDAPPPPPSSN